MAAPTEKQIKLIRDHEPALYFWGNPGDPDVERFFPSNAKRYLEAASLRLATTTSSYDWAAPVIEATRISATEGEGGPGAVYLGERNSSGAPLYLEAPGKQLFLEVTGWKSGEQHADLDRLAARYAPGGDLNDSQFWYHAEFFDTDRLKRLFTDAVDPGGQVINFNGLLQPPAPGQPALLKMPSLICYYLFFPGHEESLSGCIDPTTGMLAATARDFGSFAGEWSCIAILLDRATPDGDDVAKYVGLTNRNVGTINVAGEEIRSTMRILPWSAMQTFEGDHPRFNVARGSHALYVAGEAIPPMLSDDPSAAFCGSAGPLLGPGDQHGGGPNEALAATLKVMAGAAAGSVFGFPGTLIGMGAGLIWGIAEFESSDHVTHIDTSTPPSVAPTVDAVTASGFVVHPVGKRPADATGQAAEWKSADGVEIGGRLYDFTVDRTKQVLWGNDPEGTGGYTGRWGPLVRDDAQTRRAGMTFPKFWHLFFDTLVRNEPPSRLVVLTRNAGTTWTVPKDWNNTKNAIECIAGGGGGAGSGFGFPGGGGGGGGYARIANVALTPGDNLQIQIGAGGSGGSGGSVGTAGGDTWFGGPSLAASLVGARGGGTPSSATSEATGGLGGANADGVGTVKYSGGNGGSTDNTSYSGSGGGGAAGPQGNGGAGGKTDRAGAAEAGGSGGGGSGGGGGAGGSGANGTSATTPAGGSGGNNAAGVGGAVGPGDDANGNDGTLGGGGSGASIKTNGTGGNGGAGQDWDAIHGAGGGGGGGSQATNFPGPGGSGGAFGGGGGGAGFGSADVTGGNGADGILVIRYTPA